MEKQYLNQYRSMRVPGKKGANIPPFNSPHFRRAPGTAYADRDNEIPYIPSTPPSTKPQFEKDKATHPR